jgi:hypothetical protein
MKKLLLCLILAIGFAQTVRADETSSWTPSVSLQSLVASKYVGGSGAVCDDQPVLQADLFLGFKNGLYVDLWNSAPIQGQIYNETFATEQDFTLGWNGSLHFFDVGIFADYCDEPGVENLGAQDMIFSELKVSKQLGDFTLFGVWDNYTVMPDSTYPGGNLFSLGLGGQKNFFNIVNVSGSIIPTYDVGSLGLKSGWLLKGGRRA